MKTDRNQKKFIFICNGKDCIKNGARVVRKDLEREIRANKQKKEYKIIETRCMDKCKEGPSVVINGCWFGKVSPNDVNLILTKKAAN